MIIRVVRRERGFTSIDNRALTDSRLSFKATGVLAYLLSMPDEWSPRREHLASVKTDGEAAIRTAFKELVDCGYLVRRTEKLPDGQLVTVSEIHEVPVAENRPAVGAKIARPLAGKPPADKPPAENRPAKQELITTTDEQKIVEQLFDEMRGRLPRGRRAS